ncbi:MAG: site-specific integrase [Verrucomicrobiota bacterium]|jgi:hypothetical protein
MNLPNAIERLRDVLLRQHKSLSTEDSYVYWLRHYVTALNTMGSSLSSEQKLENCLTGLARHRGLAASTQNQAFNAILFFYNEGWKSPVERYRGKDTSCRTCTSVSKKCMNAPGVNCPDTLNAESITPLTWVQGFFCPRQQIL